VPRDRLALLVALAACSNGVVAPPRGQILLTIDTDAPIAEPNSGPLPIDQPQPLFDRVRVDVLGSSDALCDRCSNDFPIDAAALRSLRVSVGIVPAPGVTGVRARVRLYVSRFSSLGEPNPDSTIDAVVSLPTVAEDGIIPVTVLLLTDNVGLPASVDAPVAPLAGTPSRSMVGTWGPAARVVCNESVQAQAGEVCIPGGAYWMGSDNKELLDQVGSTWHRLAVLSPFYMDSTEVTAGTFRASGLTPDGAWSGGTAGTDYHDWCTVDFNPSPRDVLPANCIGHESALAFCRMKGATLPSEAQFEYVASGLRSSRFSWGSDDPTCADAVWGRAGFGIWMNAEPEQCLPTAQALGKLGGPERPGFGLLDHVDLPAGGSVYDLAGNVSEWVLDSFQSQTEPYWAQQGVLTDPLCTEPTKLSSLTLSTRGGDWSSGGQALAAAARNQVPGFAGGNSEVSGFRCVRPAPP
jgi:formylglycine-generating enzyme